MKEFWRKHCTSVIAGIMLIAIIVLLYVILTSSSLITGNEAQAEDTNDINDDESTIIPPVDEPLVINEHPRAAASAMGFPSMQTLMGSEDETLLDAWSFLDKIYLIIKTASKDLDFNCASPSLSVAVLDTEGTLLNVALLNSDPKYLSSKITGKGLMLLVNENNKTNLLLFDGEKFSSLAEYPAGDSAKMFLTSSETVFTLSTNQGIYFCTESGNKRLLTSEASNPVEIMQINTSYYLFFENKIIIFDQPTCIAKILPINKTLVSVLPTMIDKNFGFMTVEKEGSLFYSCFYKQTSFSSSTLTADKIIVLGKANKVFLTKSAYGYTFVLSSDSVDILSLDSTLSSPQLVTVKDATSAYSVEAYGTEVYLIAKTTDTVTMIKRSSNTVKTELLKAQEGKVMLCGGKIWAVVDSDDISLILCA